MWGMSESGTNMIVMIMVIAVWSVVMRLIGFLQARGRRVVVETPNRIVVDVTGLSVSEARTLVRDLTGQDIVSLKATVGDVRQ